MKTVTIKLIRFYQYFSKTIISSNALPLVFQSNCRYYPTCSEYTIEAINKYGFLRGLSKGLIRLAKCNPFHN